jgi:hypothetical protein
MQGSALAWGIVGAIVIALLALMVMRITSPARLRRRLRKTRDPIVSKARQPSVKFSVKTPPKE